MINTENDQPHWIVAESLLRELVNAAVVFGERGGLSEYYSRVNELMEQCRQTRALNANELQALTLQGVLSDQKKLADKYNAKWISVTIGGVPSIGGWDARITLAEPGVIDMDDSDDE